MKKHALYIAIAACLVATGAVLLFSKDDGAVFSHKPHIDKKIKCTYCHKKILESVRTDTAADIPSRAICNDCHKDKPVYAKMLKLTYSPVYHLSHKLHVADMGLDCRNCHEALYVKDIVPQKEAVVKMEYCFQCHDNSTATQYCMLCHTNPTKPDDHTAGWDKIHGKKANADLKSCLACHTSKSTCLKCHRGARSVRTYHNPNFELSHRYESRLSLTHCRACHSERQCRECHKSRGVEYKYPPLRKRHPLGWSNPMSSNFHGRKARLNITTCTTCHTKNECNYCHFWFKRD